jgi:hypothetical protein
MPTVNPSKENTQKGNTPRGQSALGPSASVSENIKDGLYVDSCDMAELAPGRHPITEVKAPAGVTKSRFTSNLQKLVDIHNIPSSYAPLNK